jgi:predicted phosphodiesterase
MRIALVSDIHANLQAWNAVLLDVRALGADTIVCLGDIIGYGPDPSKVLASVHSNVDHILLGNHDAAICGKMDASLFNDSAREIIAWSASKLNNAAKKFLASLPLSVNCDYFRCAHGDFANPAAFNYIFEPADAMPSWQAVAENLLFSGHTHVPQIFVLGQSGIPRNVAPQDFVLEDEKRYIVTVGSVGQPRDNTTYASYCLYDTDKKTIFWRNIPFDIDAYRAEVENSGISMDASVFLKHDPRLSAIPVRQRVNFSPSATKETEAKDTVLVKELGTLQKTVKKWKVSLLLLSILFLLS